MRFLFGVTLERPALGRALVFVGERRKISIILSLEEVADVLEAAPGPKYQAVLAYLSRYAHRVAVSNSHLVACDKNGVTFRWKGYVRREGA